jgi:hypothetical protein
MYGMGRNGVVSMNKFVKILLGTLAGVIIVGTILKQSGVISKIHYDNEIDKMAEEKRSWESKAVGNAKFYLEIYDYTGNKELGDDFIGFRVKSKKDSSFSDDGDVYVSVKDMEKKSYRNLRLASAFQVGENGDISKKNYYYFVLPMSCEYLKFGNKKFKTDIGEINTKARGKVKFNICLFHDGDNADVYKDGAIVFHDKNGKDYEYVME